MPSELRSKGGGERGAGSLGRSRRRTGKALGMLEKQEETNMAGAS